MPAKLTEKRFGERLEQAAKLADLKGARFEADSPAQQLRRKAAAIVLPSRFNASYLPHYFRGTPAPFHIELYEGIEHEKRMVVRAPRGHAKSTVVTFAYTLHQVVAAPFLKLWCNGRRAELPPDLVAAVLEVMRTELDRRGSELAAVPETERDDVWAWRLEHVQACQGTGEIPLHYDPYVQIIAATEDTAAEFTEAILLELLDNELIRSDWGEQVEAGPKPAAGDWVSASDVRVRAFGMMSAIRGGKHRQWRPTLQLFDDPDSEQTIGTVAIRERQTKKITAGANYGLEPHIGRAFMLGTPLHPDCQVCRFTVPDSHKRWKKIRYAAILDEGGPNERPLWAGRWTVEALRAEEDEDPEAFAMEMMDRPPGTGKPVEIVHYYDREKYDRERLPKVLAFDPALGKKATSDFQALIILRGPTREGWLLVHEVELLRIGDPTKLVDHVNDVVANERPDVSVMETIGFQSLLECMSSTAGKKAGLLIGWTKIESQPESKDLRIRGIAPLINRGDIRFPSDRSCRQLEHQVLDYPDGKRDGFDALEMAVRQHRLGRKRRAADEIEHLPARASVFRSPAEEHRGRSSGAVGRFGGWL